MIRCLRFAPILLLLSHAPPSRALERVAARIDDDRADAWSAGATTTIRYYNICTGWVWIIRGVESSARVGVEVEAPAPGVLVESWHYVWSGIPPGWGYTGQIAVNVVDASGCPAGSPLASQAFLPLTGWNRYSWNVVTPTRFSLNLTTSPLAGSPLELTTDHPGPAGGLPPACGTCYPVTRVSRSFRFGSGPSPLCPPDPFFFDGVCDAELLWDVTMQFPVTVEPTTWGQVKALYR